MKRTFLLVVLLMVTVTLSGCLRGGSPTSVPNEGAAVKNLMDAYFQEELDGLETWDDVWNELATTEEEEAFMEDLETLLTYYGDTFTILRGFNLLEREIEPLDSGGSEWYSRQFRKADLLNYDDVEQPPLSEHFDDVFRDDDDEWLFERWLSLHPVVQKWLRLYSDNPNEVDVIIAELLRDIDIDLDESNLPQLDVPDPVVEVTGNTAQYIMTFAVSFTYEFYDDAEMDGEVALILGFDLEKASDWRIVGVSMIKSMDLEVPIGETAF